MRRKLSDDERNHSSHSSALPHDRRAGLPSQPGSEEAGGGVGGEQAAGGGEGVNYEDLLITRETELKSWRRSYNAWLDMQASSLVLSVALSLCPPPPHPSLSRTYTAATLANTPPPPWPSRTTLHPAPCFMSVCAYVFVYV
jgi:hypothetical protein